MRKRLALLLVAAVCLSAAFLVSGAVAQEPKYGGVLRWREVSDPPKLDPAMSTDTSSSRNVYLMFDMLVDNDPDGKRIVPRLAESWEASPDGKTWTFHLRKGVKFHRESMGKPTLNGGREVKAQDWKYSFERLVKVNSPRAYFIDMVKGYKDFVDGKAKEWTGIKVIDDYTLQFDLDYPFSPFLSVLAYNTFVVVPKEDAEKWGTEPFRIGLWVGQRSTPNWNTDSDEIVKEYRKTGYFRSTATGGSGSPHQLTNCPWCGAPINPGTDIVVETYKHGSCRTIVYCPSNACIFNQKNAKREGLPILVVDEEVYRRLPSLLIATVDKFAQMPWRGESQMLFGRVNGFCSRHGYRSPDIEDKNSHPADKVFGLPAAETEEKCCLRPPDLIIQDELHLINGPLGTLVGLYETAVDILCNWELDGKTVRPKVIASSATIRKAPAQINSLYLRQTNIFPPNGLLIKDNFFSRQRTPDETNPGRMYLGICAPGSRLRYSKARKGSSGNSRPVSMKTTTRMAGRTAPWKMPPAPSQYIGSRKPGIATTVVLMTHQHTGGHR